jgi:hypothetical protein
VVKLIPSSLPPVTFQQMKELDKAHIFDQGKDQEVWNTKHLIGTVNYGTSGYTSDHASAVAQVK